MMTVKTGTLKIIYNTQLEISFKTVGLEKRSESPVLDMVANS